MTSPVPVTISGQLVPSNVEIGTAPATSAPRAHYDEAYRHFDTMIWQMPAWATAVFLGAAAVLGQTSHDNLAKLLPQFSVNSLITGFLLVVFGFLFGLTHVLFRFRAHQAPLKPYTATKWWSSAATQLQIFVTAQAFVVLHVALGSLSIRPMVSAICAAMAFLLCCIYREVRLRSERISPTPRL